LPRDVELDGELWSGRDEFQSIVSTVRKQDPDPKKWNEIKFMIFDAPFVKGTFKERLDVLSNKIGASNKVV
jgi:DNA ligase-1